MFDYDRSNFLAFLTRFSDQVRESQDLMKNVSLDGLKKPYQNLICVGMGGSAVAGELVVGYCRNSLEIPALVCRNYQLPACVNKHSLVVAISYSGDTEETLSAVRQATEAGAVIVGISTGGELEDFCKTHQHTHIRIPDGLPPRQALGYFFFSQLYLLERLSLISVRPDDVNETEHLLHELVDRYSPATSYGHNLANHIAQSVYHAVPVIYSGAAFLHPVAKRWRNQFNANAKAIAFSNTFPELNHNEIMGWEGFPEVNKHLRVILLRDPDEHPRVRQRINVTKELMRNRKILFGEVFAEGDSRLARLFSLIYIGDWASYYLAMLNEKDPMTIASIELLKDRLSKVTA